MTNQEMLDLQADMALKMYNRAQEMNRVRDMALYKQILDEIYSTEFGTKSKSITFNLY